jgi:hypothetical protein
MSGKSKDPTIKERLACLETKQDGIASDVSECKANLSNHLEHHFWLNMTLVGAVVAEAIGFLVLIAKHVL